MNKSLVERIDEVTNWDNKSKFEIETKWRFLQHNIDREAGSWSLKNIYTQLLKHPTQLLKSHGEIPINTNLFCLNNTNVCYVELSLIFYAK